MDIKELLKKYWFVGVIALVMIAFIIIYSINLPKDEKKNVETYTQDGQYVVYSIDDGEQVLFADELYDTLYNAYGTTIGSNALFKSIINKAVKEDTEMSTYASNWAQYILSNYTEDQINQSMQQAGYGDITNLLDYCITSLKQEKLLKDYFAANKSYIDSTRETENPRKCWHILIKVENVEETEDENGTKVYTLNATEEEQAKIDQVLEALKEKDFKEVAKELSEDGSAANQGYLGIVSETSKSQYVEPFANACMSLEYGVVSEPVITEYGWHLILVDEASDDDLLNDADFFSLLQQNNSEAIVKAILEQAELLGYEIKDENLLNELNDAAKSQAEKEAEEAENTETEIVTVEDGE